MKKILIIEDNLLQRKTLKILLESLHFIVDETGTLKDASRKIDTKNFDVILLDLVLPDGNGIQLLKSRSRKMASKTIITTANATIPTVVEAIKIGAINYLEKPINEDLLVNQINKVIEISILRDEHRLLRSEVISKYTFEDIVYESKQMDDIVSKSKILAKTNNSVLIQGGTGVGKELIAHSIHNYSHRKDKIFLPLNCASIPNDLFESELFGFEKGAFTGATGGYRGRFVQADGGTLFMDEIGELPLHVQSKLLRVLDENVIYQLKSKTPLKIDVRLITATNKDLLNEVSLKQFRSDLYYRLKESSVTIPPLRERVDDILPLIHHFIKFYNHVYNKDVTKISKEAEYYFLNYSWNGNIRELKNTIKSIIPFKTNKTIEIKDISYSIIEGKDVKQKRLHTLEEYQNNYIYKVLKTTRFNISRASEILKISRPRLYRIIKGLNLEEENEEF